MPATSNFGCFERRGGGKTITSGLLLGGLLYRMFYCSEWQRIDEFPAQVYRGGFLGVDADFERCVEGSKALSSWGSLVAGDQCRCRFLAAHLSSSPMSTASYL